jgi:multiple sugar transport system permease protein
MFIAGNLVPFQVLMIPVRELMLDTFGLYDTRWALIVFHTAFQTGFCTLFMRNFFRQLPDELFDAARLDGWSELRIFWSIGLPLVRPALAAMAAIVFTFVWNDYFWALTLVHSNDARPVTAGLQSLKGMWVASWNLIAAGSLVAALPPVALFFAMQRHFIAGLTSGAAEG